MHVIKTSRFLQGTKIESIFGSRAAKTELVLSLLQKPSGFLQGTKSSRILLKSYKNLSEC